MRNALEAATCGVNIADWNEKIGIKKEGRKVETGGKDAQPFQLSGHLVRMKSGTKALALTKAIAIVLNYLVFNWCGRCWSRSSRCGSNSARAVVPRTFIHNHGFGCDVAFNYG